MKTIIISLTLLTAISFVSCKKDKTDDDPAFVGGITITTPTANDTVSGTQTILTGTISGNMTMHGYHVVLYKVSDNSILDEYEVDQHATSITLQDTLNYSVSAITPVKLHVESAYNHDGDMTTKDVLYVVRP